ncbi:MAG: hypothetical protein WCD35_10105 [Mycobacteriales bacterium]
MNAFLLRLLRRTAGGVAVIAVGVPWLQGQVPVLTARKGPELSVSGDVTQLSPGHAGRLVLTVRNDGDAAAVVRRLSTRIPEPVAGCRLVVAPWTGEVTVPPGGNVQRAVTVTASGPGCRGASWRLEYLATG